MATSVTVERTVEMAHRLILTEGKCNNIHGHSMRFKVTLQGEPDATGKLEGWDLSWIKEQINELLDLRFDHHLILNAEDPFALLDPPLPGMIPFRGDPTIENIAKHVHDAVAYALRWECLVEVVETGTNSARYWR